MVTKVRRHKERTTQRVEELLARVRMDPVLARPTVEALAEAEVQLTEAAAGGEAKTADALSMTVKRLQESLGLSYSQRPPEADPNQKAWLQALAYAAAEMRFVEARWQEEAELDALVLEGARTKEEVIRAEVRERTAALKVAYQREFPPMFREEMLRVCEERGVEPQPDWLVWRPPVGRRSASPPPPSD